MALPPAFLDELRHRTPLAGVVGRRVRLARSGRQWKGCCPFHGEKTPSFYVYEDGHYHCFGCGAHGDAIGFVMQSEGAGFMDAVERLAAEAGLEVPKPSPDAAEAERRRLDLSGVLDAAQAAFHRRLFLPEGRKALAYLGGRGLSEDTIRRFGLGWSGEGRGTLLADLGRDGITVEQLLDAGLARRDDETGRTSDLFFNRVMFPIRDRRGRIVSFGGRTLGDAQPKYLNGPETALFAKRRTLYGLDLAREAVRGGASLVVVEGYMDVIALAQAGIGGAVAPLGTALTEEQLMELWRLAPSPILCFDGDAAGARAALRSAELALPALTPDRTLRVAHLPSGDDPDTFVRSHGRQGFASVLAGARPLHEALFAGIGEGVDMRSPDGRARFRERLEEVARRIDNRALAAEYRHFFLGQFFANRTLRKTSPRGMLTSGATRGISDQQLARLTYLVTLILRHPGILQDIGDEFEALDLPADLGRLREQVWEWMTETQVLDSHDLLSHLNQAGVGEQAERVFSSHFDMVGAARKAALVQAPEALRTWVHVAHLMRLDVLDEQISDAKQRWNEDPARSQNLIHELTKERLRLHELELDA